jgi:prolyl oligopeptidase
MRIDRAWAPTERGGRYFYWKRHAADDLSILYLKDGEDGQEAVLIDPHKLSEDHTTSVSLLDVTTDGTLLAYGIRQGGEDEIEVRLLDVTSREELADRLPRGLYSSISLKPDRSGLYYGLSDRSTGLRIYYHAMGSPASDDTEIFGEGIGSDNWLSASLSDDGRHLLFTVYHGWARTEIYYQDLTRGGEIIPIVNDLDAQSYGLFAGDTLVMQTDWNAPRKRILAVDLGKPARGDWREVVPEAADTIEDFSLAGGRLFVQYLHDVTSQVKQFTLEGEALGDLELPGIGTASAPSGRWESKTAFFDFVSFTVPRTTYRYDVSSSDTEVWARDDVPVDSSRFEVEQVWYPSKDGTAVPMFLVHEKGLERDGNQPVLLYGYGGFNVSETPRFSTTAVWWAEQGGLYALANIRGGGEFGEAWHKAGMLGNKQNVFDDFTAAAEWLIDNGYTRPGRLAIQGGSNGGLLVGAALTQRPDLYQAVLCQFPDLDMVRYYQFENNNPPALMEYGDASDPDQFKFLYAYSPYQKVRKGVEYPAVMLTTGDADTRVPPLQARKMTAVLQWATSSSRPILLMYDTKAGHAGSRPITKAVDDLSMELAFLSWQLGLDS